MLQIDLCNAYAGVAPRARDRQRHKRFRVTAEVNGAVINLLDHSLGKLPLLREVEPAADDVHGRARYAQLLLPCSVNHRDLGDRRNLAKEAQAVKTSLLDVAGRPKKLRRPTELVLDVVDKMPDLCSRGCCLLTLDADQRGSVVLKREPQLDRAVGEQGEGYHSHE